jgi:two-component system, cell cycle sensor histidine kinase and response regulator CckA
MKEGQKKVGSRSLQRMALGVFREALENATDGIGFSTPQGRHYYQNKAFTDLFGIIGENPAATLYCDEKIGIEVFRTIMGGGTWTGEVAMYARDRRILNILLRAYAIKDEQGSVIGLVGIHTDITERRGADEALKLSEATYREIFNNVNDTIWIHDIDTFKFIDVNNKVTEMFGYTVGETLEMSVADISSGVPPFTKETAMMLLKKARAEGPQLFEWHTKHKDGHLFWTEVSLKRGTIAGRDCLLAIERDITERKRAEETLRRINALESLGTVAGGIAHDFNNLLMGVFGNIELAKMNLLPDHPALASLQDAHKALENARHLTAQLLTFARGGNPVLETVDLRKCIRESVLFHLTGSNVAACFDIPANLWPAKADKGQIAQVISNLTLNGKEAMPEGGTLHVQARNIPEIQKPAPLELRTDCVKLTFRDEGIGIPENIIGRIFDPYFSTKQAGSGLGLAIAHGIISRHKGYIGVESAPGAGTTFTVFLPADSTKQSPSTKKKSRIRKAPPHASKYILLVDDEEMIRETTSAMLERLGCTVETAVNGNEAIDKCAAALKHGRPFDVMIMDLTIPGGMGGKEAVGELLALDPSAKVIVSSGYSSDPVIDDYSKHGFSGRLKKPFTLQELNETLSHVLNMA